MAKARRSRQAPGRLFEAERAVADFSKAIEIAPSAYACSRRGTAHARIDKDPQAAFQDYSKAIELGSDPLDHFRRGELCLKKEKHDWAIKDFTEVIRLAPDLVIAYEHRAGTFCLGGWKEHAIADEKKVIELGGSVDVGCQ